MENMKSFSEIYKLKIQEFPRDGYEKYYSQLGRGTAILDTDEKLDTYFVSYFEIHQEKLNLAFTSLFKEDFKNKSAEIIDWGCGQALASCVLIDFIKDKSIILNLSKFTLIEPSLIALQRGEGYIDTIYQQNPKTKIVSINEKIDNDTSLSIEGGQSSDNIKIHLFSNVIDIESLKLEKVYDNVITNFGGLNYFVCVSPLNEVRLKTFYEMFVQTSLLSSENNCIIKEVFRPSVMKKVLTEFRRVEYVFKTNLLNN